MICSPAMEANAVINLKIRKITMNYFEMFDLPATYKIDKEKLNNIYLKKQKELHQKEDHFALDNNSSVLNAAYSTLSHPIKRAEYFLRINGHDTNISRSDKNAMNMFEIREKYEALSDDNSREQFQNLLENRIEKSINTLHSSENNLDKFHEQFEFLSFMHSFLEKVRSNVYSRN